MKSLIDERWQRSVGDGEGVALRWMGGVNGAWGRVGIPAVKRVGLIVGWGDR